MDEESGQRGMEGWINGCIGGGVFEAPAERADSSLCFLSDKQVNRSSRCFQPQRALLLL